MADLNAYVSQALALGFTAAAPFDVSRLVCRPEVRRLCDPEKCTSYGKSWICPPGCGELPNCAARLAAYRSGLLVQSRYDKVDTSDAVLMKKLAAEHNRRLLRLRACIAEQYPDVFWLSTGGCELCGKCTYPDSPCCRPALVRGSLSAFGIDVGELCSSAGMAFSFTPGILRYVGCVLV